MKSNGFTLIELIVTVLIIAILSMIAVPSYISYLRRSEATTASGDLVSMSLALENVLQKNLLYPDYGGVMIPNLPLNRTNATGLADFSTWAPALAANQYSYSVLSSSTNGTYTLTATEVNYGANCTLTLTNANIRTATGSDCGFTSW